MFTDLDTFQVEDFNPLFSDVHSGLNFSFKCPTLESENTVTKQQYIKFMSYGEIGRVPIDVVINVRMTSFFNKLLTYNQKLSSILYRIMYMLSQRENVNFKWINHIKSIFDNVVMFGINKIQFI